MADLGLEFDHSQVEHNDDFSTIPNGEYFAQIIESEVSETKAKNGTLLKLTWQITEGEYENRRIWQQLCIKHQNETAQKIAQGHLKQICEAFGIQGHISNSEELHGYVARVKVGLGKKQEGYEQRNEIKKVSPYAGDEAPSKSDESGEGETAEKPASENKRAAAPKAAKSATGKGSKPWKKAA